MSRQSNEEIQSNLRSRFANLSPAKRALLQQRLKEKGLHAFRGQIIPKRQKSETAPLSFSQQRLWFLNQYEANSSVYNVTSALRFEGRLDRSALEQSLNEIAQRHEALRTRFISLEGEATQVIAPTSNLQLSLIDLDGSPAADMEDAARRVVSEEALRPFDLAQGALFRNTLVRLSDGQHILVLAMHHIVSDGWSMGVLYRELAVLYQAFSHGQPSPLAELPIQYADYAIWQREWFDGPELERQLSYWKRQLAGAPGLLALPLDYPRPPAQSYRGRRQTMELSAELTRALKALSQKEGVTLFMTLLAAFQTLLYRYTGQVDVVVGSPIANRNHTEIEGLIGFFVNTLVLRTDLSGNPTFRELMRRVHKVALEAYDHQDLPFEKLVEELKPERSLSHSPLFQVMIVLQNASTTAWNFNDLAVSPVRIAGETAKFDLTLSMQERAAGLQGALQYNTDLFSPETITRMLGHWEVLLQSVVDDPNQAISFLPMVTVAEKEQLIKWNDTEIDYPRSMCLHQLFEEQVQRTPDAVAVDFEHQQLTYGDLNRRANQLAHSLRKSGVGPDVRVGVCVERSLAMPAALLAIMKAGGAYVPLDSGSPDARLAWILEDSGILAVITERKFSERFPKGAALLCLDDEWAKLSRESPEDLVNVATPANLAYVIYTSGTTGNPKGVMVEHRSLVNYLYWFDRAAVGRSHDKLPVVSNFTFDASLKQLFAPLLRSRPIWILPDEMVIEPAALVEKLAAYSGVGLNCVPTLWSGLLDEIELKQTRFSGQTLSALLLGGEELSPSLLERTFAVFPDLEVWNLYGPTEATANAIVGRITRQGPITLGTPIGNTQVFVLDRNLQPVPVGVNGELYMGGEGLARGYLGRADLTAEMFIPNAFSAKPGARLYRTGDMARYRQNGDIQFLGRSDNQVKIRGFRIELGEVEGTLTHHPSIEACAVVAQELNPTERRLVAYTVARQPAPTAQELRSFLRSKLPEYMVPSTFVSLESFPLTPHGKLDRAALPMPDHSGIGLDGNFSAPQTQVEEILAGIWAEVVKVDRVGTRDNFFDLGGHSLLATQVVSRLNRAFGVELALRVLFEAPTVSELAARIETIRREASGRNAPPIVPVQRHSKLPLSFAQERLWFVDQYEPNSSAYNMASAVRLKGSIDIDVLGQSLNETIRRHESLRTTFSTVEGEPVQVIAPPGGVSLPVLDFTNLREEERETVAEQRVSEESRQPFELSRGPLFRSKLLRLGADDHILLITMHHIVSDGWSMGVLYRELAVLYRALLDGESSPLATLPVQYADFAIWQRQWLQGAVLDTQVSYWRKQLAGLPTLLNFSKQSGSRTGANKRGARQSFEISKDLTQKLKGLSRREGVTLYMALLAAFKVLLYQQTGQTDLVIGSPIAGRTRPECEGLIGFFVNTLLLRTDLSGNPSYKELLARVREVTLSAYAHQDLPFQKLMEVLHPSRDSGRSTLARAFFAFQNVPRHKLEIAGVTVTPFRIKSGNANAALTLFMWEAEGCLAGSLNYAVDVFDEATIGRMLGHFRKLLDALVTVPARRILDLPPELDPARSKMIEAIHWATEQSWHSVSDETPGREEGEI